MHVPHGVTISGAVSGAFFSTDTGGDDPSRGTNVPIPLGDTPGEDAPRITLGGGLNLTGAAGEAEGRIGASTSWIPCSLASGGAATAAAGAASTGTVAAAPPCSTAFSKS
jgi:hypothetical protein